MCGDGMNLRNFLNRWDATIVQNQTLRVAVFSLALVSVVQLLVIVHLYNKQRVVFVPPIVDREFGITSDTADKAYIEMMSEQVTERIMNITPSNVVNRFNSILQFLAPATYTETRASLVKQADTISRNNVSQIFYHMKTTVDQQNKVVGVWGEVKRSVGDTITSRGMNIVWIKYHFVGGKYQIDEITVTDSNTNPYAPKPQ